MAVDVGSRKAYPYNKIEVPAILASSRRFLNTCEKPPTSRNTDYLKESCVYCFTSINPNICLLIMHSTNTGGNGDLFEESGRREEVLSGDNGNWNDELGEGIKCAIHVRRCPRTTGTEPDNPELFIIGITPRDCPFQWEVRRSYADFLELEKYIKSSLKLNPIAGLIPPLPAQTDEDIATFSNFLHQLLLYVGDFLWSCGPILCFLDDTHSKQSIRDAHIAILKDKIRGLSAAYRTLEMKLYDSRESWQSISDRIARLEDIQMQASAQEDEDATADLSEPDYAESIAIHNENHPTDEFFEPSGEDYCLIPVGSTGATLLVPACVLENDRVHAGEGNSDEGERCVSIIGDQNRTHMTHDNQMTSQVVAAKPDANAIPPSTASDVQDEDSSPDETYMPYVEVEDSNEGTPTTCVDTSAVLSGNMESVDADDRIESQTIAAVNAKTDLEQLRDLVAELVPASRPEPPRIHSYKACKNLPASLIPDNHAPDSRDAAVNSVLSLLKPYDTQLQYRSSARAFIGRAVRHSLNAKLFESGLHALQTFLPDDPIRLTVLLWRGNSTNWLANLSDKLRVLEQPAGAGRPGSAGGMSLNGNPVFDEDSYNEANGLDIDNEPKPTGEHIITNINPSTNNGHSRMLCTVDAVPVEITPNGRSDLCFLALVEEISILVGKEDLFKSSLLLIRGWWTYESSAYLGVTTKSFLSDSVLCVLVCSIFNQYHAVINQPLQALCIFIAEYSEVKWSDVAVTLQGVVPFHSNSVLDNQPWLREPLPSELVTSAILQRHCDFYHMSSASTSRASATPQVAEVVSVTEAVLELTEGGKQESIASSGITTICSTPYSSNEEPNRDFMTSSFNSILANSATRLTPPSSAPPTPGTATPYGPSAASTAATVAAAAALLTAKEPTLAQKRVPSDSHCYSPTAVRNFQKRVINVVHPLTNANMISTSLTAERVTKISQIFEVGARDLAAALKLALRSVTEEEGDLPSVQIYFNSFFRNILGRFSGGWRPDVFPNNAVKLPLYNDASKLTFDGLQDLSANSFPVRNPETKSMVTSPSISLNDLFDQIRYIDLVLVGRVSESALLALSLDILVGRGVLPVGEIGKSLQDIAPTRNLSGKIKEKYGGLKKFLERYPEEVVICADHPFNPHVFLRKPLNRGDLELIAKGIIPPHLRKAMALRNKMRGGSASGTSQDGHSQSGNYHLGSQQGMEGPMRHMNPNVERNINPGGSMGIMNSYGSHGNMMQIHQGQGMSRISHQMQQQAFKTQQQALAQQQLFSHQQAQGSQYRGHDGGHNSQVGGQTVPPKYFFPMRDGDQLIGSRGNMGDQILMRGSQQMIANQASSGLVNGLLGQDFAQARRASAGGMAGIGLELNLNLPLSEPYGAFGARRGLGDSPHSGLMSGDGLGLSRSLSSYGSVIDAGQSRRYGELSLSNSVLGLNSEGLSHERNSVVGAGSGGSTYDLSGQDRPLERRFSEPFRDHADNLGGGTFNPPLSLGIGGGGPTSRRASASMQQAAKSFSERDKIERDRALGIEPWGEPLYSMERDGIDERLRDRDRERERERERERYSEGDFSVEVNSELFTTALASNSHVQSEESNPDYYDPRPQRAYQQSIGRDSFLRGLESPQDHHSQHQVIQPAGVGSSLFLQQKDDELLYDQEFSLRDRERDRHQQQQQQIQRQQLDEEEQHQRLILQNQQAGVQRQGFRPTQNVFDPKKWI